MSILQYCEPIFKISAPNPLPIRSLHHRSDHDQMTYEPLEAFLAVDASPLVARVAGGPRERVYFLLPLPSHTTDLEAVRVAIQSHYEEKYGSDVLVRAEALCSSTWDEEEQTMHHLWTVEAACHHGCSARTVVEVVLQRAVWQIQTQ